MSAAALQRALFQRLTTALADLNCPVFDDVEDGAPLPYVQFARDDEVPGGDLEELSSQWFLYLTVWSDYRGKLEIKGIADRIKAAVREPLTLAEGRAHGLRWVRCTYVPEPDGKTYQGLITLSCFTE